MPNFLKLIVSIIVCQLAGIIETIFTSDGIPTWYSSLNKPSFNPPDWIFGPVWIGLYLMMGIALFLIWREDLRNKEVKSAFVIFILQLIFNIIWSIIFFGAHSIIGGLVIIIILWILILITISKFMKISKTGGILLIPYLIWITFAVILNYFIYILN